MSALLHQAMSALLHQAMSAEDAAESPRSVGSSTPCRPWIRTLTACVSTSTVFVISCLAHTRKKQWGAPCFRCFSLSPIPAERNELQVRASLPLRALSSSQENTGARGLPSPIRGSAPSQPLDFLVAASALADHGSALPLVTNVRLLPFSPNGFFFPETWRCLPKVL